MTARVIATSGAVASALAVLAGQAPQSPQTFRTATDVVMVDVSVRSGGRMVTGLGADDFVVTDNGIRQRVENVEAAAVPIDVTLVVDLSGNWRRPWIPRIDPAKVAAALSSEIAQVTSLLRPTDRIRVLGIDHYIQQIWPLQPVATTRPIERVESDGLGSVYDTLASALLQPVEPARRHVVIARTKGFDTISALDAQAVRQIAERSDALFHLVVMETAMDYDEAYYRFQCNTVSVPGVSAGGLGLCWPTTRSWVPKRRRLVGPNPTHVVLPEGERLKAGVEATGGTWHQAVGLSEPSLTGTFRDAFENFRQSYVLRYAPQGVARTGWHTIGVSVPGRRDATVSARRGYSIDELQPLRPSAPAPAASEGPLRTLADFTRAYEQGAYQRVVEGLRQVGDSYQLMREFESGGNPWPASPRREAAFAIDVAEPGLFSNRPATRDEAFALLTRFARLIRNPLEPDEFERRWYSAVLMLLQGTARPNLVESFLSHAIARFPGEPEFTLARAIAADQRLTASLALAAVPETARQATDEVAKLYESALGLPGVGAEARIRLAFVLHRAGRSAEALAHLDDASLDVVLDGSLRYLRYLFRGHALEASNHEAEAAAAYQWALTLSPTAQSARVALMNVRMKQGDRQGAEGLAEAVQTDRTLEVDPWWLYWQGQYRLHVAAMARLRELAR